MELEHQSLLGYKELDRVLQDVASDDLITIRISGDCMTPVLQDQELVQVRRQSWYLPGDILAVRLGNGRLVSHRLVGIYPRRSQIRFLTWADGAKYPDGAVTKDRIVGKITSSPGLVTRLNVILKGMRFSLSRLITKILSKVAGKGLKNGEKPCA